MYLTNGWQIPFMMQAWWLFVICTVIYFLVSYATPRPSPEITDHYTWDNPLTVVRGKLKGMGDVRIYTILLIITLVTLYIVFS